MTVKKSLAATVLAVPKKRPYESYWSGTEKTKMPDPQVGDRIRVRAGHWCRSNNTGVVAALKPDGRALIRFDHDGAGFHLEGQPGVFLYLDSADFVVLSKIEGRHK